VTPVAETGVVPSSSCQGKFRRANPKSDEGVSLFTFEILCGEGCGDVRVGSSGPGTFDFMTRSRVGEGMNIDFAPHDSSTRVCLGTGTPFTISTSFVLHIFFLWSLRPLSPCNCFLCL
jgi:hypothetical protein